jgi:membrane-bound lytic murein transglycosylase F
MTYLAIVFAFLFVACTPKKPAVAPPVHSSVGSIEEEGKLVVVTRTTTTSYFIDRDGEPSGFEYELMQSFAKAHNLQAEYVAKDSTADVIDAIRKGEGHIAAAGLSITEDRKGFLTFTDSYQEVHQNVVCGKRQKVKSIEDLKKLDILISKGTSQNEVLADLRENQRDIAFVAEDITSESILEKIWEDRDKCTLIDSNISQVHRRYFPELLVVYEIPEKHELAWAVNPISSELTAKVNTWLKGPGKDRLKQLMNKYYGHVKDFDYYDTKKFLERIETRLPKYRKWFEEQASKEGLDWKFLAAVSYQESQWKEDAVSHTGVRGLMMLTKVTAKEMGIEDRTDPKQSIQGGAKYLKKLIGRIPRYIPKSQRKWYGLASYNVGYYHLRDAVALAVLQNKNPTHWVGVKEVLPLLSQRKYFKNLRYGYARGLEPVIYVTRIRNYYDILRQRDLDRALSSEE